VAQLTTIARLGRVSIACKRAERVSRSMAPTRFGTWLDGSVEMRRGSFKDGRHDCLIFRATSSTRYAYAIIYHYRTDNPYITILIPHSTSCTSRTFCRFSRLSVHENAESGFLIDFPETTHALSFLPFSFFPSSYPLNYCSPTPPSSFSPILMYHYPALFCSAALLRCCTSSHTITTPHSGLSSSIITPSPPSLLSFYHRLHCVTY